jgi:tetratricopeptide (TPR) repeat protein
MRFVFPIALTLLLLPVSSGQAADGVDLPPAKPAPLLTHAEKLDGLFLDLRKAKSQAVAESLAKRIWEEWFRSGSASIDLLMLWSNQAIESRNFPMALDFLDQVVVLKPDFAEGWNRRATLHFMMNNFAKSMVDIERTLELEPRHFGALSGMGQIFLALERKELALKAFERALAVYPMMRDVQKQVGDLADELAGSRT